MKKHYIVAQNAFSISAPDNMAAMNQLEPRFRPFEVGEEEAAEAVFAVDIRCGRLTECDAERIYEPVHSGIGFIAARALRRADGCLILEFLHIEEAEPRLRMTMNAELTRADIAMDCRNDVADSYFLTHALMIAFMLATCGNGTLLIHSSAVILGGKAYIFQGKSGTGKSTHARMWLNNIPGTEQLNDDNPLLRFDADGTPRAYGSPWSGKTHCYRNVSAPIGAFVRIVRAPENQLRRLAPLQAYASLTTSVYYMPFLSERLRDVRHRTIERLVASVGCCEMHCRPDADAAFTCLRGLMLEGGTPSLPTPQPHQPLKPTTQKQ